MPRRLILIAICLLLPATGLTAPSPAYACSAGSPAAPADPEGLAAGFVPALPAWAAAGASSASIALRIAPRADEEGAGGGSSRILTAGDLSHLTWRSIGPSDMGGRVAALAYVPGSRTSFYVGYGTGGLFFTDNMGTTFKAVFDDQEVLSIGAVAVADAPEGWSGWEAEEAAGRVKEGTPRSEQGKGRIVWVGTGEGNGRNSSTWGGGVYRSTDGGRSFTRLGLEQTHDIPRLAVDPRNPDVAYVAALGHLWGSNPERGIYKTSDGGKSWDHVLFIEGPGGGPDGITGACDVVIDPRSPDTVYAALYARRRTRWSFQGNSETGGIFRSDDGGATWTKLTDGLPPRTGRIGLAVFPGNTDIVYAVVESDFGGLGDSAFTDWSPSGGVFRTADRGGHWERTSALNPRPFYFSRIAVDPENDQRVYLPGWDLGVSDDGGKSFRRSGSEGVHVDFHAIAVNPEDPDQIIVGNDGGVYITHDRAESWDHLNNVAVAQFYRIDVDMSDPYRVAGGLQDNGSWMGPSETIFRTLDQPGGGIRPDAWRMVHFGDGFTVRFDPESPNILYATSQGGYLARVHLDKGYKRYLKPEAREGQERLRFNWDAPFIVSKHDPSVLYHGGNKLFKLTDRGDLWFAISGDLTRNEVGRVSTVGSDAETYGTIVSLDESPLKQGLLWVGSDDGLVHVTRDEGATWTDVTPDGVNARYVSRVTASMHDESTAFVAVDGHRSDSFEPLIWMTTDLGASWKAIQGDLPAGGPVRVIVEDPASADVLYCGTEFGAFVSLDRGGHWVSMNKAGLPPVAVHDIAVHPRERDLILGTHGRSAYIMDDGSMFAQLTPEVLAREAELLEIMPGTPRYYDGRYYGRADGTFKADNPPLGAAINYWLRDGSDEKASIRITDAGGTELRKLEGTTWRGLNRVVWDLQADRKHLYDTEEEGMGLTQFVPAGDYTVTLMIGKQKVGTQTVTVKPAPDAE